MRFDFVTLRLFLAAADEGNLAKASERIHIAPSAASKRISTLEYQLGVQLFDRNARGVTLTVAGQVFYQHVRNLMGILDRTEAEMSEFAHGAKGFVRVHAHVSSIVQTLPERMRSFLEEYPGIKIELHEETSPQVVRSVGDGVCDIGFFSHTIDVPLDLEVTRFCADRLMAVVPVGHVLSDHGEVQYRELVDHDMVGFETPGSAIQTLITEQARKLSKDLKFRIGVTSFDAVRRMVEAGLGVAVLPESSVRSYTRHMGLVGIPLSDDWAQREIAICTRGKEKLTVQAQHFLGHVLNAHETVA